HFIRTAEESKFLNETAKGAIIISASGMCDSGRILHHLKHNLWRPESHVLFVGYQAEGTLGRRLQEGAQVVKIFGEEVNVQAQIHSIDGFSAHADQTGLLEWLAGFRRQPRGIFVVHGEKKSQSEFAALIQDKFNVPVQIPSWGERFTLNAVAHRDATNPQVAAIEPSEAYYSLDRVITDLEHAALSLRSQIQQAGTAQTGVEIRTMKKLLAELESLLKITP
ncbi:MAG TPA: MBL fold metallo-hydrolase RNA specificity domain-containing protein, partial [Bacillota bacterium]|nr:MBL fold metallo-hydrolase RNA specificity domain-containing protein [Bacillota bacterium]